MQTKAGISGSTLKLAAMGCMLIDHFAAVVLGSILVKNGIYSVTDISAGYISSLLQTGAVGWIYLAYQMMRNIMGRWAFPIYCFLLVEGFGKTKNRRRYAGRLLLFAFLSEVPFDLAFSGSIFYIFYQNVFFTLLIGFLMMGALEKLERLENMLVWWIGCILIVFAASVVAEVICCDYGAHGVIAIAFLYLLRKNKTRQMLAGAAAFLWEVTAPLAFVLIAFYNGKRGIRLKYFFYFFYPVHLLILYLITLLF